MESFVIARRFEGAFLIHAETIDEFCDPTFFTKNL